LPEMSQGILIIATGVVTVLAILAVLMLSVELVVLYDERMRKRRKAREKKHKEREEAEDPRRVSSEIVAAIGMALHQYLEEQRMAVGLAKVEDGGSSSWTASGRLEIMAGNSRVITRGR